MGSSDEPCFFALGITILNGILIIVFRIHDNGIYIILYIIMIVGYNVYPCDIVVVDYSVYNNFSWDTYYSSFISHCFISY